MNEFLAIVGPTASGKSALGVELAIRLKSEIINADALQVYNELPIATARISELDRKGVNHHLLGFSHANTNYSVCSFQQQALNIMQEQRIGHVGCMLVGGTAYYVEAMLFDNYLAGRSNKSPRINSSSANDIVYDYDSLKRINPAAAERIHPNDIRKIRRALEVTLTDSKDEFASAENIPSKRFQDSTVIITSTEIVKDDKLLFTDVLEKRICNRVDSMLQSGLLAELTSFYFNSYLPIINEIRSYNSNNEIKNNSAPPDCSDIVMQMIKDGKILNESCVLEYGIFQTIGFKEFLEYLKNVEIGSSQKVLEDLVTDATERLKIATIRYAKKQIKWINNHLIPLCKKTGVKIVFVVLTDAVVSSFKLTPDEFFFNDLINDIKKTIVSKNDQGKPETTQSATSRSDSDLSVTASTSEDHIFRKRKLFYCDECGGRAFQGMDQYSVHIHSRGHKRTLKSLKSSNRSITPIS